MTFRLLHLNRLLLVPVLLGVLVLGRGQSTAEPVQGKEDQEIAKVVYEYVTQEHLRKPEINDEVAGRLLKRFVKDLDPARLYFEKSDVDEFKKLSTALPRQLRNGDLSLPYLIYSRLVQRMTERQKLIEELVAAKQDYTVKEDITIDDETGDYAATADEIKERWRKRIKFDLLMQQVDTKKPLSEEEAHKKILTRYQSQLKRWKQTDNLDLLELYLTDFTTCIDPHSTYMSPSTLEDFVIAMRLNLEGIGAVLRSENGQTIIVEVVPGGPAGLDRRLKANDKIVGVAQGDGKFVETLDMKLRDVVKMIRGPHDTKVQLKVLPEGKIEPVIYELTRKKIEMKNQEAHGEVVDQGTKPDGKPYRIGVIDLPSFYGDRETKSATDDVRKILMEFKEKKVDGVILDLRQNGGGLLDEALSLTGLFIDNGPVVQVKDARGVEVKVDPDKGIVYDGPLVVAVSRMSASASEILAGALKDYGRALIVGDTTTFGKGTVQKMEPLDRGRGGALKLTIQQFYRVNGDSTQIRGVESDVVVPSLSEFAAPAEKEQDAALAFDSVPPVKHADMKMVPAELKAELKSHSAQRIKDSKDFTQLTKDIDLLKARKARKTLPLNEKDLRERLAQEEASKIDEKIKEIMPDSAGEAAEYKFKRNFVNKEILKITEEYIQGLKK